MSENKNPTIAIDAILDTEKTVDSLTIYPMTMARYALLELVDSPFISGDRDFKLSNMIETFYIMCQPKEKLKGYNSKNISDLFSAALEWADGLQTSSTSKLIDDIATSLGLIKKIAPQATQEEGSSKKDSAPMAG